MKIPHVVRLPAAWVIMLWGAVSLPNSAAAAYLTGSVTLNGSAYTANTSYVSLNCNGANWSYCSDWVTVGSDGTYSLSAEYSYECCSSSKASTTWSSCQIYAYQYDTSTVGNSDYATVTLDCTNGATQDIALQPKEKTIAVTLMSGESVISTGMTVNCWEDIDWSATTGSVSSDYSTVTTATAGVYNVPAMAGTYKCSTYCDWNTYGSNCPYTFAWDSAPSVTLSGDDTSVATVLHLTAKDKVIQITPYLGSSAITSGVRASCSQQESPWTWGEAATFSEGTLDVNVTAGSYRCSCSCANWPCAYEGYPEVYVTVGSSDATVAASCVYETKDKVISALLVTEGGAAVSDAMNFSCYKQGGSWDYSYTNAQSSDGTYKVSVGSGTYSCSAYCSNYASCGVSGYPRADVKFGAADTSADVTLTYLDNNATVSGVVTDGASGIGDVWVNLTGNQVVSGSGAAVTAIVSKAATVNVEAADATQVYGSAQTDASGAFSARVPAGTYSVCVWPPYNRQNLAATCTEVTAKANATAVVSLAMQTKTATIQGTVTDADGNAVNAYINCSSYTGATSYGGDYAWAETTAASGAFALNAVEGRTYQCTASANTWSDATSTLCSHSNEGMQSVTATATAQTINFTIPNCDCALTINTVDAAGTIIADLSGSCSATPATFSTNEYYYGLWSWIGGGSGVMQVEGDRAYSVDCWFYDHDYAGAEPVSATCSNGATSVNMSLAPVIEDAVCGSYVDGDGTALTLGDDFTYLYVNANRSHDYRSCDRTATGYCCDLTEGDWIIGYWVNTSSGFASGSAGDSSSKVTVPAGGGLTHNITLLKTGSLAVSVLDLDTSGRSDVTVECCPYSAKQEGANSYQHKYGCSWCYTKSDGACTAQVGAATEAAGGTIYYCNAFIPYGMRADEHLNNPVEQEVTAYEGVTAEVTLEYEQPDGMASLQVIEGTLAASSVSVGKAMLVRDAPWPVKQVLNKAATDAASPAVLATVDCFSPFGGAFQTTTDDSGVASCPCTTDHTWYAVAYRVVGNVLYQSAATEVSCTVDGATASTIAVDYVTTVPESKSPVITNAADQSLSATLSDGFSVSFPKGAFSTDASVAVTCNIDATVTPFTANKIPAAFYGYSVYCFNSTANANGAAFTQLGSSAQFCLPYNAEHLANNLGLDENGVEASVFDPAVGGYTANTGATVNSSAAKICFDVLHLTDFVITGNGYLGGVQGTSGGQIGTEEKVTGTDDGSSSASGSGGCGCRATPSNTNDGAWWMLMLTIVGFLGARRLVLRRYA